MNVKRCIRRFLWGHKPILDCAWGGGGGLVAVVGVGEGGGGGGLPVCSHVTAKNQKSKEFWEFC